MSDDRSILETAAVRETCPICGVEKPGSELRPATLVRPPLAALVRQDHPDWCDGDYICTEDLHRYRLEHMRAVLAEDGDLSEEERNVLDSMGDGDIVAEDTVESYEEQVTFGDRMADKLSAFGGSWTFIGLFLAYIAVWITLNTALLLGRSFDPYPFILLNLTLSLVAAIQAPVIMMSQNRREQKDRTRAENDYEVNLKAELEIRQLQEKLDYLIAHQWQRLMEIQRIQTELIDELSEDRYTEER